jgi:hypothetical protein
MAGYIMDGSVPLCSELLVLVSERSSQLHPHYFFNCYTERRFRRARLGMKTLLRCGLVSLCAIVSAGATLGLVWFAILKMEPSLIAQKMNLDWTLYIFPVLILAELYFFMNDFLAYLSKKHGVLLGFDLSEICFTYDLDVRNSAIPLRSKLLALYPITIALLSLGSAVAILRA